MYQSLAPSNATGTVPFVIAWTTMTRMQTMPPETLECSRAMTPPFTIHGAGKGSDDKSSHMKLEPLAELIVKELSTVCDWVEEMEN